MPVPQTVRSPAPRAIACIVPTSLSGADAPLVRAIRQTWGARCDVPESACSAEREVLDFSYIVDWEFLWLEFLLPDAR